MTNYFEALAQQQMVAATKARHRTAEKRAAAKVVQSEKDAPITAHAATDNTMLPNFMKPARGVMITSLYLNPVSDFESDTQ